jgi:hypothetical protein
MQFDRLYWLQMHDRLLRLVAFLHHQGDHLLLLLQQDRHT